MASEQPASLAAALAAVQKELPRITKDKTARVEKNGVLQYTYKYADLADVSAEILPLLGRHGLAFSSFPTINGAGKFVLSYTLMHEGGEERTGEYPLPDGGRPQDTGGWITYARRYALSAVTGVATEEDTDWRGEPEKQRQPRAAKPRAEANGHAQLAKDQPGSASNNRGLITSIQIKYQELGFKRTERDDMLRASETIIGRELTGPNEGRTHNNLSEVEARKLRDTIGGYEDRGDLLAALVEAATP